MLLLPGIGQLPYWTIVNGQRSISFNSGTIFAAPLHREQQAAAHASISAVLQEVENARRNQQGIKRDLDKAVQEIGDIEGG